ncbi:AMP-dependent synthetase/ligase [Diplocloster modestus]|uniref:AMP-binding protein n=1 Tax=Diplocloster modestus TaxID=2850322 RepID=A0ABS6K8X4_9FIRM|nr:AMP-binding protein [Diplocloster modestus]MBU9726943.1 AMP-binding protein [Diplocloster modestus]
MKKFPLYDTEYFDTIPAYLDGLSRKFGTREAISYFTRKQEKVTITYEELILRVTYLKEELIAMGMAGCHIAIVSENSCDWVVACLAVMACGSVAVCVDIEQSDDSIREMVQMSDAAAVFTSAGYRSVFDPVSVDQLDLKHVILMGAQKEGTLSLEELCEKGRKHAKEQKSDRISIQPEQPAVIAFTSGTTSKSKLVILSHKNILKNMCDSCLYVTFEETVFCSLPFYHTYGLTCSILGSLLRGTHVYINGDLKTMLRDLKLAQPDTMLTVPLIVESIYNQIWLNAEKAGKAEQLKKLLKLVRTLRKCGIRIKSKTLEGIREQIAGNLHIMICGGAHLGKEISEDFESLGILILQGYGITECSPLISVNSNRSYKMGSVGYVLPSCEVRIVEDEIWVRGDSVMEGYYKSPEQTKEVMENEWFKTGDLGYQDKDGCLYLTGRKKNLIVFKNGKKTSPEKLEEMIMQVPLVKEVVVTGTASGTSVDDVKITASIYPDPDRTGHMSSYEILEALQKEIDSINEKLPTYQQVQMINIREKEFSKTGTKKIKRHMA